MLKSFLSRLIADAFHATPRRSRSRRSSSAMQGALHAETLETRQLLTAGDLDLSFGGGDGIVTMEIADRANMLSRVAVHQNGKVVAAGNTGVLRDRILLTQLNADGSRDPSFGNDGVVETFMAAAYMNVRQVLIQSDGKILVGGVTDGAPSGDFVFAVRYEPTGAIDEEFGQNGILMSTFGDAHSGGIALQSDGSILLAGTSRSNDENIAVLSRYTSMGSLDHSFGAGGIVRTVLGRSFLRSIDLRSLPDGRILIAGEYNYLGDLPGIALLKFRENGDLDLSFGGGDGIAITSGGPGSTVGALGPILMEDITVAEDGAILVAGSLGPGVILNAFVARYLPEGELDRSFGQTDGFATATFGGGTRAFGAIVQPNGSIVVAGLTYSPDHLKQNASLIRFNSQGLLDLGFGGGVGIAMIPDRWFFDVIQQADGRLLGVGGMGSMKGVVARFLNDTPPTNVFLTSPSLLENQPAGTAVGVFTTADEDTNDEFVYTLVSGEGDVDNSSFRIVNDELQSNAVFDFESKSSYSIRIRTTDPAGLWFEKAFTISVLNVNEAPTGLALSGNTVAENQRSVTTVGQFTTTDPDAGNTFSYSLVNGPGSTDNPCFRISGNTLRTTVSFDFEEKQSYSIRVRTTDQDGLSYEQQFTIVITDVNPEVLDFLVTAPGPGLTTLTGNQASQATAMSRNGNVVVFASQAANLVAGDTNSRYDVFARDLTTGVTERVSVSSAEVEGNTDSSLFNGAVDYADVNADGRYVVFSSSASNLGTDANFRTDIFRRDRQLGITELVSSSAAGAAGNADSAHPAISADGNRVLFRSRSTNFTADATGGFYQIFMKDMTTGAVTLVSQAAAIANSDSEDPTFSPDGQYVFFKSSASNLVAGDTNGVADLFRKDLTSGTIVRVNTGTAGQQAVIGSSLSIDHVTSSNDGRYAAFMMYSNNLGVGIFRKDLLSGTLLHISTGDSSSESFGAAISGNGDIITFGTTRSRLAADTNSFADYYSYQVSTNSFSLLSVNTEGAVGTYNSDIPTTFTGHTAISADGSRVAFTSAAAGLISQDFNAVPDVFVRDIELSTTTAASIVPASLVSTTGAGADTNGVIYMTGQSNSFDGRYVAFTSNRSDLVDNDTNGRNDVFRHDRLTGETVRVNVTASGGQSIGFADSPAISPDGRYVAFKTSAAFDVRDIGGTHDIYVKDLKTGSIRLVTIPSSIADRDRNQSCDNPSISGVDSSGNYYVTWHTYRKMVAEDTSVYTNIYRWYSGDNRVELVSKNADGVVGNHFAITNETGAQISADGRYVAFASSATNLVPNDTNGQEDIFVKDMQTGAIVRASVDAAGNQFLSSPGQFAFSRYPSISGDGKSVAFTTYQNSGTYSHYVRNLETGTITLGNTSVAGARSQLSGTFSQLSHDGRYLAFVDSGSIAPGPWSSLTPGVHIKDLQTGLVVRADSRLGPVANSGLTSSWPFSMSPSGRTVVFRTTDSNFIAGDLNNTADIFAREWVAPPTSARDFYHTNVNTTLVQSVSGGVLANDVAGPGGITAAVLQTGPASGTLTLNANGSFTYVPVANFRGEVWFSYWATDGYGYSEPVRATIYVEPDSADLAIAMAATSDSASPGDEIAYAIQYFNLGPKTATGTTVTWQLPANASLVSATGSYVQTGNLLTWTAGNLAAGSSGRFDIVTTVTASGSTGTVARVNGSLADFVPGNNVVCSDAPADLRNWWRAENSAIDRQGAARTRLENEAGFSRGYRGEGFVLDGANDSVAVDPINLGSNYSLEFWAYPTRANGLEHLVSNAINSTGFGAIYFNNNRVEYYQNNTLRVSTPANSVALNAWSHIGLTYDGAVTRLYLNGVLQGTSAAHSAPFNGGVKFGFAVTPSNSYFRGKLDEVAFYGRALTPTEMNTAFMAAKCDGGTAPSAVSITNNSINENKPIGTTSGFLSVSDSDAVDAHVFKLVDGAGSSDNAAFRVVGTTLSIRVRPDFESKSQYNLRLQARDSEGNTLEVPITVTVNDMLEVEQTVVGDGSAQRSLVQKVDVVFDSLVSLETGAINVSRRAGNGLPAGVVSSSVAVRTSGTKTIATITFSGEFTRDLFGTLVDGYYTLNIDAARVQRSSGTARLDGNRDGDEGGSYVFGSTAADKFFARFGDLDGDGIVGNNDYSQFTQAYGKSSTQVGYRRELDYKGVGLIRVFDFNEIRRRLNQLLQF